MKAKLISLFLLVAAFVQNAQAEEFDPQWNLQLQAGAAYTLGEASFGDLLSPAVAVSVGYQFSPSFGVRANISGFKAKGANVVNPSQVYSYNYVQGAVDLMYHVNQLFTSEYKSRLFDPYVFAGIGCNYAFNNDEAVEISKISNTLFLVWEGSETMFMGHMGIGTDINITKCFALNVEYNTNMLPDRFNSKRGSKLDWQSQLLVGVTFKFGGNCKAAAAPVVVPEPEPEPQPAPAPKPAPKPQPAPAPVAKVEATTVTENVFYDLDSSKISSSEQSKISNVASFMKNNPSAKVTVTGYADEDTGSSSYNKKLSEKRAESVKAALVEKGIAADRISTESKGCYEQPFSENDKNRVAICVAK